MVKQISLSIQLYIYILSNCGQPGTYNRMLPTIHSPTSLRTHNWSSILPATSLDPAFLQSLCFRRSCNTMTTSAASPALWLRFSRFTCLPGALGMGTIESGRLKIFRWATQAKLAESRKTHDFISVPDLVFFGLIYFMIFHDVPSICLHHHGIPFISPAPGLVAALRHSPGS